MHLVPRLRLIVAARFFLGLTFVWDESVVVFCVAALFDECVNVLPLKLLTQVQEDVLQLLQHHRPVLLLVVKLQTLNKVLK